MKNLETEYKKQITEEVPDLWGRIESSVDAIEAQNNKNDAVTTDTDVKAVDTANTSTQETNITDISKRKKKIDFLRIGKYSAIVAAAACVLVVVLAVSNSGKSMSTAPNEAAAEAAYDTAEMTDGTAFDTTEMADSATEYTNEAADEAKYDSFNEEPASAEAEAAYDAAEAEEETDAMIYTATGASSEKIRGKTEGFNNEIKIGAMQESAASKNDTKAEEAVLENEDTAEAAELLYVHGVITGSKTTEKKGKDPYYITITDTDGNEYEAFVPEKTEAEVRKTEKEGKECIFVLTVSASGDIDAEYILEEID